MSYNLKLNLFYCNNIMIILTYKMVSLYISYALNQCSIADVTETFDMTFDGEVVVDVSEAVRVDKSTHRPFKMFWIEVQPNRRMDEFLADIKSSGSARLYFKEKGISRFWNVRFNQANKPFIMPKTDTFVLGKKPDVFEQSIQDLLTGPLKERLADLTKQDEDYVSAFKIEQQKKLVKSAEEVFEPDIALKRFLAQEKIEADKRLDAFMASQGETEFNRHLRHHAARMESLIQC